MKTRYFLFLSFKGSSYHGWQIQPNSVTVQKIIDEALTKVIGEKISSAGAGRTDTGVHARFFCAHFESDSHELESKKNLIYRLNRFLPSDIAVSNIKKVVPDANARYSAIFRTYKYFVSRVRDPFSEDTAWFIHGDLDIESMNKGAEMLLRSTDFTSFSRLHSDNKTNICNIIYSRWELSGDMLVFTITADRFLRNMVRAIVGTMIDLGRRKITPEKFEAIILAKDRSVAGTSAPARGLFLVEIAYPDEIFI